MFIKQDYLPLTKWNHKICENMEGFRMYDSKWGDTISERKAKQPTCSPSHEDPSIVSVWWNRCTCWYRRTQKKKTTGKY